jgi:hypothetical protein
VGWDEVRGWDLGGERLVVDREADRAEDLVADVGAVEGADAGIVAGDGLEVSGRLGQTSSSYSSQVDFSVGSES